MDEKLSPEEAFALLGDETRVAILEALWESPTEPLSFSTLHEAVGTGDSGRFNYHLKKLVGHFVTKDDDGYRLRQAGWQVMGAVVAGTYTHAETIDEISVDDPCPLCGGSITARYADERMTVACTDCEEFSLEAGVPPGVFEGYEREEVPYVFERWGRALVDRMDAGFCTTCSGRMEPALVLVDGEPLVEYDCIRCPDYGRISVGSYLLEHPAVVAFHERRGVDPRETPVWRLAWTATAPEVVEAEPLSVAVTVTLDDVDDRLRLVVDETLNVSRVERK